MRPEQFISILKQAGKLKTTPRHCWLEEGRYESVAEHSWRLTLMAMLVLEEAEFQSVDGKKVLEMCLIHDLGESFLGDIPAFVKNKGNSKDEYEAITAWVDSFEEPVRSHWLALLGEMKEKKTAEAKLYKALDKMEALISHDEADIGTWLPLEYDLQITYGRDEVGHSPTLTAIKDYVDDWTREKIATEGVEKSK